MWSLGSGWQVDCFIIADETLDLSEVALMIVGNKVDLEEDRKVPSYRPMREYKEKFDIDCWETSAKTG